MLPTCSSPVLSPSSHSLQSTVSDLRFLTLHCCNASQHLLFSVSCRCEIFFVFLKRLTPSENLHASHSHRPRIYAQETSTKLFCFYFSRTNHNTRESKPETLGVAKALVSPRVLAVVPVHSSEIEHKLCLLARFCEHDVVFRGSTRFNHKPVLKFRRKQNFICSSLESESGVPGPLATLWQLGQKVVFGLCDPPYLKCIPFLLFNC